MRDWTVLAMIDAGLSAGDGVGDGGDAEASPPGSTKPVARSAPQFGQFAAESGTVFEHVTQRTMVEPEFQSNSIHRFSGKLYKVDRD
jgi:hypothetical protein